jgi:pheromone shutdown protein TraB
MTTETKRAKVLVIGTGHELQRHQDTTPKREEKRAKFEDLLREIAEERKVTLIAEEAGDDKEAWEQLKKRDEADGPFAIFGETVDSPVPTIAKEIADEYGIKHEDVDVDVRADEKNPQSVAERDEAMAEKILKVSGNAESILVIVGEAHRLSVAERLKSKGFDVESLRFP